MPTSWNFPRVLLGGAGALLLISIPALAKSPARRPNFTGIWVMDTTKFEHKDARLTRLVFRVVQKSDTLRVVTETSDDGHESSFGATYGLDGKPRQSALPDSSGMSTVTLSWASDTLVLGTQFDVKGRGYTMTQRWSLDALRTTMTEARTAQAGGRHMAEYLVFTKR